MRSAVNGALGVEMPAETAPAKPARGSRRLFGRANEIALLNDVYARVRETGRSETIVVSGPGGIGKSSLVRRFHALLGNDGHRFASGKSDLQSRNVVLAPILQMLRDVTHRALADSDAQLERVRACLRESVGREGRSVVDLLPETSVFFGHGPALPELAPALAQARVRRGITALIGAFATREAPLILFVDDLQWADASSLSFLAAFVASPPPFVLLVVASRIVEADPEREPDPLADALNTIDAAVCRIPLVALTIEDTADLLLATLGGIGGDIDSLALSLHGKTTGNPFFLQQIVQMLQEDDTLAYDPAARRWNWAGGPDRHAGADGDILGFMAARFDLLNVDQRDLLATLALMDGYSSIDTLAAAARQDAPAAHALMEQLSAAGLVVSNNGGYGFPHDRIREAGLLLTSPETLAERHAFIAKLMIARGDDPNPEHVFRIANHIVQAVGTQATAPRHVSPARRADERLAMATFLHRAAQHATKVATSDQIVEYVESALALAAPSWWDERYPLMFALHFARCEHALLGGRIETAENGIQALLVRATQPVDRAACYRLLAGLRTVQSDYDGAITAALDGLRLLGLHLARYPDADACHASFERIRDMMERRTIADLADLPVATDPHAELTTALLAALFAAIFSEDGLRFLHAATIVELTLQHGVTENSAHGLAWFGVFIADMFGRYEDGFDYACAALAIVDRYGFEGQRTDVLIALDQVSPWTQPLGYALARARDAIAAGDAAGDLGMTCYARNHLVTDMMLSGAALALVEQEADRGLELTRRINFRDIEILISAQRGLVRRLTIGERMAPYERLGDITSASTRFWVRLYDGIAAYLSDDPARAVHALGEAGTLCWAVPANIDIVYYELFAALAMARHYPAEQAIAAMAPHRARLATWQALNPTTFTNKLSLVDAELARLRGDQLEALRLFDRAAGEAAEFVHERALAHEMAGRHAVALGLGGAATHHLQQSAANYRRWGADDKAAAIANLATGVARAAPEAGAIIPRDLLSICRALSGEMRVAPMIQMLMRTMMSCARARSGMLLVLRDGDPIIEALSRSDGAEIRVDIVTAFPTAEHISPALLKRDLWARASEILPGSLAAGRDTAGPAHVLWLTLLKDGEPTGAIILTRDEDHPVFTHEEVEYLEQIAAQAAVSLKTARLHTDLTSSFERHYQAEESLRVARAELARTSQLSVMGGLTASIAHEINQPLASVVNHASAARRWLKRPKPDLDETLLCIDSIHASGIRAADIVRSLRALAKQEAPDLLPISPNAVVLEVIEMIRPELDARNIQLICQLGVRDDTHVSADRTQLQQVIHNLLSNAIDALEDRPITDRRVTIATETAAREILMSIADNGCGIPPDRLNDIASPLFTTKTKGMGMGLSICKSIIEVHGGTLTVRSTPEGTIFSFPLPLCVA